MNLLKKQLIKLITSGLIVFYAIPFIALNTSPLDSGVFWGVVLLIMLNPVYSFMSCLIFAKSVGFKWYIGLMPSILFFFSLFINYNLSANIYIIPYLVFGYIGSAIGHFIHRRK